MIKRLRLKFVLVNMVIFLLMLGVMFFTIYHMTQANLEEESLRMLQAMALAPQPTRRPDEKPEQVRLPYFSLQLDENGELTETSGGYFDLSDETVLKELAEAAVATQETVGVLKEYSLRFCASPQTHSIAFADMTSELTTLDSLVKTFALLGAAGFLAFLGISILLSRWAVKPVAKAWTQQRQFVADASHELKTPLTVIMTNAELLQSADGDPEDSERSVQSILVMAKQMRSLVEQLLELARADNAKQKSQVREIVALSELTEDGLLPFEALLYEAGLTLETNITPNLQVRGDGTQLRQVLEILLDNAGKYAEVPGTVRVSLERTGHGRCRLTVANTGPALTEQECQEIFKRFYRADRVRSRDGGFGLGLSIAQQIVAAHHGRIWAESREGWNRFAVELKTA